MSLDPIPRPFTPGSALGHIPYHHLPWTRLVRCQSLFVLLTTISVSRRRPGAPIKGPNAPQCRAMDQKYTVIVRDEEFTLRKSQIDFDAPNYFTAIFLGDFSEGGTTTTTVDRNPDLFAIIVEYLSGYHILPLASKALPRTMDSKTAMLNLIEDAAFYGLLLKTPLQPKIDFAWTGFSGRVGLERVRAVGGRASVRHHGQRLHRGDAAAARQAVGCTGSDACGCFGLAFAHCRIPFATCFHTISFSSVYFLCTIL